MKINVVLLGQYRLAAPLNEFLLDLPAGSTAASVVAQLRAAARQPVIPATPVVAVNHVQSPLESVLNDGDELALLPPVAGG